MDDLLSPGDKCGPYTIERELGRGGMGVVYLTRNDAGQARAIKVLLPRARLKAKVVERFQNEVQLLSYIEHVHVVRFYEAGVVEHERGTMLWVALEFLEGKTLREIIHGAGGPLPADKAVRWTRQMAQGVNEAHKLNVVHRDLKPENVIISPNDLAKVYDFGIAKFRAWGATTTQDGERFGTVAYMAPEQLGDGSAIGATSDIYAIGLMMYEMVAGKHPYINFEDQCDLQTALMRVVAFVPPSVKDVVPNIPGDLSDIVDRAIAKDPKQRFSSLQQLDDALAAFQRRRMDTRREAMFGKSLNESAITADRLKAITGQDQVPTPQAVAPAFASQSGASAASSAAVAPVETAHVPEGFNPFDGVAPPAEGQSGEHALANNKSAEFDAVRTITNPGMPSSNSNISVPVVMIAAVVALLGGFGLFWFVWKGNSSNVADAAGATSAAPAPDGSGSPVAANPNEPSDDRERLERDELVPGADVSASAVVEEPLPPSSSEATQVASPIAPVTKPPPPTAVTNTKRPTGQPQPRPQPRPRPRPTGGLPFGGPLPKSNP